MISDNSNSTGIFMIASERSGTNLLRTLLGNHSEIAAPIAPHFLATFNSFIRFYGDLRIADNSKSLVKDMIRLANHPYHDWNLDIDVGRIDYKKYNNFTQLVDLLYTAKAHQEGKKHYVSKGIHNHSFAMQIQAKLTAPKFVYLSRDPRDHVASWMRTPLFMHTSFDIIKKWTKEQNKIHQLIETQGIEMHHLRYEDLISDTPKTMSGILDFLDVPIDEACFSTDKNNKESNRNEFWKNLSKPIIKNNKKKYHKYLNTEDLLIVETFAKMNMQKLGYSDFETKANWKKKSTRLFNAKLKLKRAVSKYKNKDLKEKDMHLLEKKLSLVQQIQKEAKKRYANSRH